MLFRDELEEGGAMDKVELEAAVAERRAELLAEAERQLAKKAARAAEHSSRADKDRDRDRDRGDRDRDAHSR